MKLVRIFVALLAVGALAGVAYVGQANEPAGHRLAAAADQFLGSLSDEQKARATFDFDSKERTHWHFVPRQDANKKSTRNGVPLEDMNAEQKKAALALLKAGTSATGYTQATTIMSLEAILHDLEKGGAMVRNPGWYFFAVFGTPSKTGKWGWRVEGHHLSLNFTLDKGRVISATPAFFGANPATVKAGPRKGLRTLPEAEDLARDLFRSLSDEQKKEANQDKLHPEIEQVKVVPGVGPARGLEASKMEKKQRALLEKLVRSYADRMPPDVAAHEMKRVEEAGMDNVRFAYAGGTEPGKPHTYRVQGPTFVIEFINTQRDSAGNPANHIHSAWRNLQGDFGLARQ